MMRCLTLAVLLTTLTACKGRPARLVAGVADTVIVNSVQPVQIPIQVLDDAGRILKPTGVRYEWRAGTQVSVSSTGMVTCTQAGDATVLASLGAIATQISVRCRPVSDVRALRMINLVVGDSAQELPFEAVGVDGQPVSLLAGRVTVDDSTVVTLDGQRVRGRSQGATGVTMRVGNRSAFTSVHVYQRAPTPEEIRPGQHVAVRVRVAGGEMHRWRLPASREVYYVAMLPYSDPDAMPSLAIVGANCSPALDAHSYFCLAPKDASVIVYHSQQVDPKRELNGTLAVWRQQNP